MDTNSNIRILIHGGLEKACSSSIQEKLHNIYILKKALLNGESDFRTIFLGNDHLGRNIISNQQYFEKQIGDIFDYSEEHQAINMISQLSKELYKYFTLGTIARIELLTRIGEIISRLDFILKLQSKKINFLISFEGIFSSFHLDNRKYNIENISRFTRKLNKVELRLCCVIRNQASWIKSAYRQEILNGYVNSLNDLIEMYKVNGVTQGLYYYKALISPILDITSKSCNAFSYFEWHEEIIKENGKDLSKFLSFLLGSKTINDFNINNFGPLKQYNPTSKSFYINLILKREYGIGNILPIAKENKKKLALEKLTESEKVATRIAELIGGLTRSLSDVESNILDWNLKNSLKSQEFWMFTKKLFNGIYSDIDFDKLVSESEDFKQIDSERFVSLFNSYDKENTLINQEISKLKKWHSLNSNNR